MPTSSESMSKRSEICLSPTYSWRILSSETCRSCVNRLFGGTYSLHLQGRKIHKRATSVSRHRLAVQSAATCSSWFLACRFFYPEDGGDTFLRNFGSHKIYTAQHHRRRYSSQSLLWKPQILLIYGYVLKMEAVWSFETSVDVYRITRRHTEECSTFQSRRCGNLIFSMGLFQSSAVNVENTYLFGLFR
jgi:hypothetical protein